MVMSWDVSSNLGFDLDERVGAAQTSEDMCLSTASFPPSYPAFVRPLSDRDHQQGCELPSPISTSAEADEPLPSDSVLDANRNFRLRGCGATMILIEFNRECMECLEHCPRELA
jgi:hypothetical protein